MTDPNCCPDCGELLMIRRGVVPLTATLYCPSCLWCDVADGDRQANAVEDWIVRKSGRCIDAWKEPITIDDEEW